MSLICCQDMLWGHANLNGLSTVSFLCDIWYSLFAVPQINAQCTIFWLIIRKICAGRHNLFCSEFRAGPPTVATTLGVTILGVPCVHLNPCVHLDPKCQTWWRKITFFYTTCSDALPIVYTASRYKLPITTEKNTLLIVLIWWVTLLFISLGCFHFRFLSYSYLVFFNVYLLLCPSTLSYDWQMDSIPLVETLWDVRNLATLLTFVSLGLLAVCSILLKKVSLACLFGLLQCIALYLGLQ